MSAKKRHSRLEWTTCQECDVLITNKDFTKHKGQCARTGRHGNSASHSPSLAGLSSNILGAVDRCDRAPPSDVNLQHGFIRSGLFYGEVCLQSSQGNEKLPSLTHQYLIHFNPETMKLCHLCIGRPVLLTSCRSGVRLIGTAWPVANFPAASIGLDACLRNVHGIGNNELLRVDNIKEPVLPATEVKIFTCVEASFLQSSQFRKYFLRSVHRRCVLPGSLLFVSYYGTPVVLQVLEIALSDGRVIDIEQPPYAAQLRLSDQQPGRNSPEEDASRSAARSLLDSSPTVNDSFKVENESSITTEPSFLSSSDDFLCVPTSTPKRGGRTHSSEANSQRLSESFQKLELDCSSPHDIPISASAQQLEPSRLTFSSLNPDTKTVFVTQCDGGQSPSGDVAAGNDLVTFDKIGGLSRQLKTIRETLELPLKKPEFFKSLGVSPPRGVLMYGPPGVGKTMIARAVANEVEAHVTVINGPEIMSKYYGESEARLRGIFQDAAKAAPSLIFIDELDSLCPHRDKVQSDLEKRIVATLLTLMDGVDSMGSRGHLMVLGATNRPDAIDPALRRPGRFDREIEIGVPNAADRADILMKCLQRVPHTLTDTDIVMVAEAAHGYVGADLSAICKDAAVRCFERQKNDHADDAALRENICVSTEDVLLALKGVKPSAMREVEIRVPRVRWSDIGGQAAIKLKLKQAVEWPIKHPEAFRRMGITPPRGILLYGPPGCSKTLFAKALATESGLNFIAVKGPELFNKWVGESEQAVREVFRKARMAAPSIVFFDEIDALAVERGSSSGGSNVADRVLGQLLTEIDGVEQLQDVTIVAATNRPDMIDKALLRPGRLDRILYISLPDEETRREIFKIQFRSMPISPDVSLDQLVVGTHKYSGAEVVAVCREAGLAAMQEDIEAEAIYPRHFERALATVQPRTSDELIKFYADYRQKSGLHSI